MRIAYWDCFSGIAGDMNLGAMVGCGLSIEDLRADLAGLALDGFRIEHRRVQRGALVADKVDVVIEGVGEARESPGREPASDHGTGHDRDHAYRRIRPSDRRGEAGHGRQGSDARVGDDAEHAAHDHGHAGHDPDSGHAHHHHPQRGLADIRAILDESRLPTGVADRADRIFEALCEAEAAVHGCDIDEVHLHEVGAIDAIVDIVGACCGLRRLGVEAIRCSPLNVGAGTVMTAHGILPVPAPATAYLLRDAPVYSSGPEAELVTPTGAALVATLAEGFGRWPAMSIGAVGYGAGDQDFAGLANVVRLVIGETVADNQGASDRIGSSPPDVDGVRVIETNLDDANPQILGALIPKLLDGGALDAFTTPVFMKKNRPGTQLTVIAAAAEVDALAEVVLRETTTLGLRVYAVERRELARHHTPVETPWGTVRVKVGMLGSEIVNATPEFDDCERLAREAGVPVKHVIQAASIAVAAQATTDENQENEQ